MSLDHLILSRSLSKWAIFLQCNFSLLQNCSDKNGKHNTESKKIIKCSPWKHGFVQFLRKKKPSHPHRSQNNNDSVHSNHYVDSRNGHARLGCNSALLRSNQEDSSSEIETAFSPSPIPVFSGKCMA